MFVWMSVYVAIQQPQLQLHFLKDVVPNQIIIAFLIQLQMQLTIVSSNSGCLVIFPTS